jgi:hypothetical protein
VNLEFLHSLSRLGTSKAKLWLLDTGSWSPYKNIKSSRQASKAAFPSWSGNENKFLFWLIELLMDRS